MTSPHLHESPTLQSAIAILFVAAFLHPGQAISQVQVPPEDTLKVDRLAITGYPYVFFSPETQFALGGAVISTIRLSDDRKVKASSVTLSGYYSVTQSYDLFLQPEFFLDEDKYYITASIDFWRFVDKFWGIGNSAPDIDNPGYVRRTIWVNAEFDVRVLGSLKIGLNYDLNQTLITDKQENPFLLENSVTGSSGGSSSGLGAVLFLDDRNNSLYPTGGGIAKLSFLTCGRYLASDFSFKRLTFDVKRYITLSPSYVLALEWYTAALAGDPPFYQMALLGGDNIERGYFEGRYRDKFYSAIQAEIRMKFSRRWGMVAFAGMGDVASSIGAFTISTIKPSFGLGIRFALLPDEGLNVRMDVAYGRNTNGLYFNAKEAF